jgi:hypothetical protein
MGGYGKLFQGNDRKFKEFGGWVDVGLNPDHAGSSHTFGRNAKKCKRATLHL